MEQETPQDSPTAGEHVRVSIDRDEWWPLYTIDDEETRTTGYLNFIEIPRELVERIKAAQLEFETLQALLHIHWERCR